MNRTIPLLLAALVTAALLSACGGDDTAPGSDDDSHNATDVAFAQGMIPHHAQAIEMSELLLAKDGINSQVAELAEQIKAAQAPEIETMTGWLQGWDEDVPPTTGMDSMDDMSSMDGMMTEQDMGDLEAASADEASRLFLQQMTEHHSGAIDMAQQETEGGSYPDAIALAEGIIQTQQAEITTMHDLLARL
ncbi:MAG: DUF305 domain-containing protein [Actinomycetota bacterium]|jgi:uncharacterized protein (DUF305 family)|nr:DUF305 domain-containing protein [Pseudonocardiales bacterium]MBA3719479.1 DUF305 domain-containing protein [Nocardioidaceae bacterium]MDQ3028825.1 DUF305 domain-containing protein [Actinomycetota bacterium]